MPPYSVRLPILTQEEAARARILRTYAHARWVAVGDQYSYRAAEYENVIDAITADLDAWEERA